QEDLSTGQGGDRVKHSGLGAGGKAAGVHDGEGAWRRPAADLPLVSRSAKPRGKNLSAVACDLHVLAARRRRGRGGRSAQSVVRGAVQPRWVRGGQFGGA